MISVGFEYKYRIQDRMDTTCFYAWVRVMKLLLIAALAILATAHAVEETQEEHEYMLFPDGDGVPQVIDLKQRFTLTRSEIERNVATIRFELYTRSNPTSAQILTLNQISTVTNSHFNRNNPTRFVTHGWRSSSSSDACVAPRDSYLAVGNYNVIAIDWSSIAKATYTSASGQVKNVAAQVSAFINFMSQQAGLNLGTTMLIGHSLGGHIAGIAAHGASGTLQGVVALDPARPNFENVGAGGAVTRNDASNVQVIHTNAGKLGLADAVGRSDFYPNGGKKQPGCGVDLAGTCAHSRAYYFFAESIRNPTGFRSQESSSVFMGGRTLTTASGSFNLETAKTSPYALG